jgi:hypothetical protein
MRFVERLRTSSAENMAGYETYSVYIKCRTHGGPWHLFQGILVL